MLQKTVKSFDGTDIYYLINRSTNTSNNISSHEVFIIFIHGAGSNHSVYKPFFYTFENQNFIALDIRNHGRSGKAHIENITIDNIVKDIEVIVKKEQIKDVILVGNSLGATIAIAYYKKHRKTVQQMVLFTLFSKRYIYCSWLLNMLAATALFVVRPFSGRRKLMFQDYYKYAKRPFWYYPYLDIRGTPISSVLKLVQELFTYQPSLSSINVPTLIFVSLNDFITKNSLIQSDSKENKFITLINLKTHHITLTRDYEDVTRYVKRFLE